MSGAPLPQRGSGVQPAGLFWALLLHLLRETELVTPTTNTLHRTAVPTSDPGTGFCVEMAPVCEG